MQVHIQYQTMKRQNAYSLPEEILNSTTHGLGLAMSLAVCIFFLAKGTVDIELDVLSKCAGIIATNCYGVVGMAVRNKADGIASLLKRDAMSKGIKVTIDEDGLAIDVHVIVGYGINIKTTSESIIESVKYNVESVTGFVVKQVNVNVESVRVD